MHCDQPEFPSIVLMGLRASGKTTTGQMLAQRLGMAFIDMDERTLAEFPDCRSVTQIWHQHGEALFRAGEANALAKALRQRRCVIALGGGTPMFQPSRELIERARSTGVITLVYLYAPADVLKQRLMSASGDRPALIGTDIVTEVDALMAQRNPTYHKIADITIDAVAAPLEVVERIAQALRVKSKQ